MLRLGMDIGGTKIEVQVLDGVGHAVYLRRYATCKDSFTAFADQIVGVVQEAEVELQARCSVGICLPGSPDPDSGLIKNSNILVINRQPLQRSLTERLRRPVAVSNDANCFTLSEAIDGAGKGKHSVFGVIIGTGCGGGLVINQRLQQGKNGNCGEWGHNPLPHYRPSQDGPFHRCYCGQDNCIESFISGTGIARQVTAHYRRPVDSVTFFDAMLNAPDESARLLLARFRDQLARSLATAINMLDPDMIVLGGGLSNVRPLIDDINGLIGRYTFGRYGNTPVCSALHGDSSGVRGAAWLGGEQASAS